MKQLFSLLLCTILLLSCKKEGFYVPVIPNSNQRVFAGGETTSFNTGAFSFNNPAPNLSSKNLEIHLAGDSHFEQNFVTAPATINSGLGAQFNNTACIACHKSDGRASFPTDINSFSGFFLRISLPGTDVHGGPKPVPGFGDQLANHAVYGKKPEVQFKVTYQNIPVSFADGTSVILKKPIYSVVDSYIPVPKDALFSPRLAPPVFGLGLLEAIPEKNILAMQDINDVDGDGISGKANYVWNPETKSMVLGRFGWKANAATTMAQNAGAYNNDMGVTNPLFKTESSYGQSNGDQLKDDPEISQQVLDEVSLYTKTLAVPAARNLDNPEVVKGYVLFEEAKCALCHTPKQVTGNFPGIPAISNQTIYPYTDMLLHDMGDDLGDGRPDYLATGNEWKTRPLWGIGLTSLVNNHTNFLHDGRAKNIEEAILWHGGEAQKSKEFYTKLSKKNRAAVLAFINSL